MTKSKALAFIIFLLFTSGCASSGMKKPTVFVDEYNNIPADVPFQFIDRYERFITGKEQKEFKKLLTDEERQTFIDKFWAERDTDPSTPENERKNEIDRRIDDIADERFFSASGVFGLSFRTNGGFRGDMAHVYLLHGEPDAMDTIESVSHSFVPLMLWVYGDPENGRIQYAFLFYQKGGFGSYKLFSQSSYQMDQCRAIYEVATLRNYNYFLVGGGRQCPEDLYQVYNDIYRASGRGGVLNGNTFTWALFNFSQDWSITQGKALEAPKAASEVAKQSQNSVVGEAPELTGTVGKDYILSSCGGCNSMIPAELSLEKLFTVFGPWKNFDLAIKGEYLELSLKYRIILQDINAGKPIVLEGIAVTREKKSSIILDGHPEATLLLFVDLLSPKQVAAIPPGTYRVSVYVKNMMTKKYNAWFREFTK